MDFGQAISVCFSKYADFSGRARRSEYWYFYLFTLIIGAVVPCISTLVILIPSISVTTRRLHDTGRSGWWQLLYLTGIGGLVVFIFTLEDSSPGPNEYGPNPKSLGGGGFAPQPVVMQPAMMPQGPMGHAPGYAAPGRSPKGFTAVEQVAPAAPQLIVAAINGVRSATLSLAPGARYTIGRDATNSIAAAFATVSGTHAAIDVLPDGTLRISDLNSANGTFVNGQRVVGAASVRIGDVLQLGSNVQVTFERA